MFRKSLEGLASATLLLASAPSAFAHAHLISAAPAADSVLTASPPEIDLKFSEALNAKFSGVTITGPDNAEVKLADQMLMDGDTTFMATIPATLRPGTYTVTWHALSADGHKTEGRFVFEVKP